MDDPFRIELVERDGVTRCEVSGRDGWVEPTCPSCGEPIAWVLDMMSFSMRDGGRHTLMHARCAWTPEAFEKQKQASRGPSPSPR